jgi:hemerythrin-like domain-containing protein
MTVERRAFADSDFDTFRIVHRAMLQEVKRIAEMVRGLRLERRQDVERVQVWLRFIERTFEHHHTVEDRWFFPILLRRDPSFEHALAALEREHETLDPLLDETARLLRALRTCADSEWEATRAELEATASRFAAELESHLEHEEAEVVPRACTHLGRVDMQTFNRRATRNIPVQDARIVLPWLVDACTPDERDRMLGRLPLTTRLLLQFLWTPSYRRQRGPMAGVAA